MNVMDKSSMFWFSSVSFRFLQSKSNNFFSKTRTKPNHLARKNQNNILCRFFPVGSVLSVFTSPLAMTTHEVIESNYGTKSG